MKKSLSAALTALLVAAGIAVAAPASAATLEPDPPFLQTWHDASVCGEVTVGLRNNSAWLYRVLIEVETSDGWLRVGSTVGDPQWEAAPGVMVVDNRPGGIKDVTGTYTIELPTNTGDYSIRYRVSSGTESDLYTGANAHLGEFTTVTGLSSYCPPAPSKTVHSTNLAPNGWSGDPGWVDDAYQLKSEGAWQSSWITRAVNLPLIDVLANLEIVADPIQYVGLHFRTADDRWLTFEEEPGYGGGLWSESAFDGVPAGMGYAAFGTPSQFVAENADLVITEVRLLYTHPDPSSTKITSVTFGDTIYTFDLVPALATSGNELAPVIPVGAALLLLLGAAGVMVARRSSLAGGN